MTLEANDPAISPDGRLIAFTSRRNGLNVLCTVAATGKGEMTFTHGLLSTDYAVDVCARPNSVIFRRHSWKGGLAVISTTRLSYLEGTNRRERELGNAACFLGDKGNVVFEGFDGWIYLTDLAGLAKRKLTKGCQPKGTADGTTVFYKKTGDDWRPTREIFAFDVASDREQHVSVGWDFAASADGRYVLGLDGEMNAPEVTFIDRTKGIESKISVARGRIQLPNPRRAYREFIFYLDTAQKEAEGLWQVSFDGKLNRVGLRPNRNSTSP